MKIDLFNLNSLNALKEYSDNSFDAIISDPPYNFKKDVMEEFLEQFYRVSKGAIILFAPPENQWPGKTDQFLFWVKPISTKNTIKSYSRFVEMIQVFGSGKWNCDRHWSQYVNVFTDSIESKLCHPYQKPLSLMTRLILNHTDENDHVLDPFAGSGTTGVSCFLNNRNFTGFELEEKRYETALKRLLKIKGQNHNNVNNNN